MLGLGWGEILLVAGVALIVVGPERLPRLLRDLGRMYGQVRRTADDLRRSFLLEADRQDAEDRYEKLQERRKEHGDARRKDAPARAEGEPESAAFGGSTTVAEGTLGADGSVGGDDLFGDATPPAEAEAEAEAAVDSPIPDPNADDPEAPHPVQPARSERP